MIKKVILFTSCCFSLNAVPPVIKLTPPKISQDTLLEKVVCTRPYRKEGMNISTIESNGKNIVNCYGHGSYGFTTLFGSVDKALDLFQKTNPDKSTPIRIIGSGCMGLTCAVELARLGYQIAGISTKSLYDTPSWKAGGYFSLGISMMGNQEIYDITIQTFLTYQRIEKGTHPYITQEAVKMLPVYCNTDAGVEQLEALGLIPPKEDVILDFGNNVIYEGFAKHMSYFMNTTSLMQQLTKEVNRLGIPIEVKEIHSFDEIKETFVFNCSGLGAKELNEDETMFSVRGHLVFLNEDAGSDHMDYMLYAELEQDGKESYIYLFPRNLCVTSDCPQGKTCQGVLGGTFIPDVDKLPLAEQEKLDQDEFKKLLDRNTLFFNGHLFE